MSSLREINRRLELVEGNSEYEAIKRKKEHLILEKVEKEAEKQAKQHQVDRSNFFEVVEFAIDFVEVLTDYIPEILDLVGGAFTGEFKLVTAIRLITRLSGDVGEKMMETFGHDFLKGFVNHEVDLKYHREYHEDGKKVHEMGHQEGKEADVKKKCRTGFFSSHFGGRGSKKGSGV